MVVTPAASSSARTSRRARCRPRTTTTTAGWRRWKTSSTCPAVLGTSTDVTLPGRDGMRWTRRPGPHRLRRPGRAHAFGTDVFTAPSGNGFMPPIPSQPRRGNPGGTTGGRPAGPGPSLHGRRTSWSPASDREGAARLMTTAAIAPTADARRTGPTARSFGRSPGLVLGAVLGLLVARMAWGIHGLVASRAEHRRSAVVASRAAARPPGRPDRCGTVAHPALTVEGGYSQVTTPTFSALAVVNGPVVPGEGLPVQSVHHLHLDDLTQPRARAPCPISVADFDSIDHLQTVYKPPWCRVSHRCPPRCTRARA